MVLLFNQDANPNYGGTRVVMSTFEPESMTRQHGLGERRTTCSRHKQNNRNTCSNSRQLIPVHSSNSTPCVVFSFVIAFTAFPFPEARSAPASVFRTPIMPSWSVCESERYNAVGTSSHLHSPASIPCAMGLLPDVTYRVDTPLATSGCFSISLNSAFS